MYTNDTLTWSNDKLDTWDIRYLSLAEQVASWSKDPRTQVGAVIVGSKKQILSQGYNGFPRGIEDSEDRLNDRPTKLKLVVHAEMNCIYNASFSGASLQHSTLYVWGLPVCSECAKGVIQVGVKKVFMCHPVDIDDKWKQSSEDTFAMFKEAKVEYHVNTFIKDSENVRSTRFYS